MDLTPESFSPNKGTFVQTIILFNREKMLSHYLGINVPTDVLSYTCWSRFFVL